LALDDPIVIILILAVVILLFGASRIPQLARSLGQARREFEKGSKGETAPTVQHVATDVVVSPPADDPLVVAAQREGIDTQGKTKEQIASELSWKLNRK
jgi:sec-independent protein translocase protein TatA